MDPALTSCLYECTVVHERLLPRRNSFRYQLFFMDIALEELPRLNDALRLFSVNRFNFYSFRDKDHLDLGAAGIRANIEKWLAEEHHVTLSSDARIRLVTLPRILGYFFNPVCFYFIFDADGRALHAIAEVTNTFHEMKPWFLATAQREGFFELVAPKHFYVSPFSKLDTSFHFKLAVPGDRIRIHIDDLENGERTLVSWIHGEKRALTDTRLAWYLIRYPLLTFQVIAKIHWQAFRLWARRFTFYRKAGQPELQCDVLRPHRSLTQKLP